MTVKDAKTKLAEWLEELNNYDENTSFLINLDDNDGGSYYADIDEFELHKGWCAYGPQVELTNY
jgi:hypothetical protein